jgi:hypothetical protein
MKEPNNRATILKEAESVADKVESKLAKYTNTQTCCFSVFIVVVVVVVVVLVNIHIVVDIMNSEAKYYIKVMKSILDKSEFVKNELARLSRMLSGSLRDDKIDEFTKRKNILYAFDEGSN